MCSITQVFHLLEKCRPRVNLGGKWSSSSGGGSTFPHPWKKGTQVSLSHTLQANPQTGHQERLRLTFAKPGTISSIVPTKDGVLPSEAEGLMYEVHVTWGAAEGGVGRVLVKATDLRREDVPAEGSTGGLFTLCDLAESTVKSWGTKIPREGDGIQTVRFFPGSEIF